MNFTQRSFVGTNSYRPKPVIKELSHPESLIVATPWGSNDGTERVLQLIIDQIQSSQNPSSTAPFEIITDLDRMGNLLRTSLLLANQYLLKHVNTSEYKVALECTVFVKQKNLIYWSAIGSPHLFLQSHKMIHPLYYSVNWHLKNLHLPPLFSQALGLEKNVFIQAGVFEIEPGDSLFLISSSELPMNLFSNPIYDLNDLQKVFIENNSEQPFWLGFYNY